MLINYGNCMLIPEFDASNMIQTSCDRGNKRKGKLKEMPI